MKGLAANAHRFWGARGPRPRSSQPETISSTAPNKRRGQPASAHGASYARQARLLRLFDGIDALLEDGGRLEHHHPARRDRHFLAGLRVAADALALLAHHVRAERGELHRFAALKTVGDFL